MDVSYYTSSFLSGSIAYFFSQILWGLNSLANQAPANLV